MMGRLEKAALLANCSCAMYKENGYWRADTRNCDLHQPPDWQVTFNLIVQSLPRMMSDMTAIKLSLRDIKQCLVRK